MATDDNEGLLSEGNPQSNQLCEALLKVTADHPVIILRERVKIKREVGSVTETLQVFPDGSKDNRTTKKYEYIDSDCITFYCKEDRLGAIAMATVPERAVYWDHQGGSERRNDGYYYEWSVGQAFVFCDGQELLQSQSPLKQEVSYGVLPSLELYYTQYSAELCDVVRDYVVKTHDEFVRVRRRQESIEKEREIELEVAKRRGRGAIVQDVVIVLVALTISSVLLYSLRGWLF
ncbi:hypothetical protein RMQ97_09270 [Maricaulis sp. D1M11]|uniref:hypothetical protein n=1 Tax=Maricaulis sp. D1M11 TaxID=3076117 RepID=UPI0039B462D2